MSAWWLESNVAIALVDGDEESPENVEAEQADDALFGLTAGVAQYERNVGEFVGAELDVG